MVSNDWLERGVSWQQVALRIGERLGRDGPVGYYDFTPEQWQDWCLTEIAALWLERNTALTRLHDLKQTVHDACRELTEQAGD